MVKKKLEELKENKVVNTYFFPVENKTIKSDTLENAIKEL